ncbi:MAG: ACT domain protein [Candidatus Methanofastidiosum methylothiophilum]|uniref:ACT domain protein n=1 Tax=Candidatus Methanofastidiosum methylothiophilum TaxID=1705564 RepID=A0A150J259_9EURY|nr:MAG: ACT domain protein [Candidatus Methanofastidiosum methylthiophilus]KYC48531.1 MAG: ACT domain protein [Candidatus Methanofastidiosum methylthiophilus]KYC51299.1 MAG: ACT domain protein [Candidatus Methanofastidiosum methylthiophilus]
MKILSVFIENKPKRLSKIIEELSKEGISISGLAIADAGDFGIVRLIVNDAKKGASILSKQEMIANIQDVVGVNVNNSTISEIAKILGEKNVNIEDALGFGFINNDKILVLKVDNIESANKILSKEGFKIY